MVVDEKRIDRSGFEGLDLVTGAHNPAVDSVYIEEILDKNNLVRN